MQTIKIQSVPSQLLKVVLAGQNCQIAIYQKNGRVFVDLNSNGVDISLATIAHDAVPLNPRAYAGFAGNLFFIDNQGSSDPTYDGLGTRFQLIYLTADEFAQADFS